MISRYEQIETIINPILNYKKSKGFPSVEFINSFLDGKEKVIQIPNGFQYRPDKLAELYYKDSTYYWIISYVNNFDNGIEDYIVGRDVIIPNAKTVISIMGE